MVDSGIFYQYLAEVPHVQRHVSEGGRKEMAELLAGASLGAVFGELLKAVLEAKRRCVNFKETLAHLSTTLTRLGPKIQEIQKLNNELGRPKEELDSVLSLMEEGKQLVRDCSQTRRFNLVTRTLYERKLQVLIKSLEWFITIDLHVQSARDNKETLLHVRKILACVKPEQDATAASSSQTTPLLQDESEITGTNSSPQQTIEQEEQWELVGAESSYLKLHLKWMHQPTHSDSNFLLSFSNDLELKPVGILKVKLMQAKELTNEHTFRKPDLFVVLYMQASGEKGKESETINNDLNPIWNENFEFSVTDVSTEHLMVEVYDSNHLRSSKLIGCAEIRLSELQPGKVKYVWSKLEPLENQRDNKIRGQVHVELLYCPFGMEDSFTNSIGPNYSGVLYVTVISAEDLHALDFMRKPDPFVVLTLRKEKSKEEIRNKTRVVNQSLNHIWNQKFAYVVEDGLHDMVIAEVWDKDPFGKDDYIGRCIMSLTKVILEGEYTESFELDGAQSGSLKLHLEWRR